MLAVAVQLLWSGQLSQLPCAAVLCCACVPLQFVGLGAADTDHERGELKDAFAKLHAHLSLGSVPDSLPCRDEERKRLGGFLGRALHEGEGGRRACRRCCTT